MQDKELIDYLLGKDSQMHPRFGGTPTIRDLCYNAWLRGRSGKNAEDGGPCDWFNDTLPLVERGIEKISAERMQAQGLQQPVTMLIDTATLVGLAMGHEFALPTHNVRIIAGDDFPRDVFIK